MKHIVISEYGSIPRTDTNAKDLVSLKKFDAEWQLRNGGVSIFDWKSESVVKAKNYVGVIQIDDLLIEILPKIDRNKNKIERLVDSQLAQQNLLYMLSFTNKLPILERDLALLDAQQMPLLEALIKIFAERLIAELKRGLENSYINIEDNLRHIRGKIHLTNHIKHNLAHRERVYVVYDELIIDTWLNRVFKNICRRLLLLSNNSFVQKRLREAILFLDDVSDIDIHRHHLARIHLNRNTERFRVLMEFSRLILDNLSPAPRKGRNQTFSLLFPMNELFEEFIATIIYRYSRKFGIDKSRVFPQAVGCRGWLLLSNKKGKFQLKPDIIIYDESRVPYHIIDTKWKHLLADADDSKNGVSQADIYQLYAYSHHYNCNDNVLLFPMVDGVTSKKYSVFANPDRNIRIEFIDLNRDLKKDHNKFKQELFNIVLNKN